MGNVVEEVPRYRATFTTRGCAICAVNSDEQLTQNPAHNVGRCFDARKLLVKARKAKRRQACVVDAELMQNSGVQVTNVNCVVFKLCRFPAVLVDDVVAVFICLAIPGQHDASVLLFRDLEDGIHRSHIQQTGFVNPDHLRTQGLILSAPVRFPDPLTPHYVLRENGQPIGPDIEPDPSGGGCVAIYYVGINAKRTAEILREYTRKAISERAAET